jgi:uncharacterized protein (TIGR04551 family)
VSIRSVDRFLTVGFVFLVVGAVSAPAGAQMGGMGPGMGPGGGGMPNAPAGQNQPKDEGPAQQAPEEPGAPTDLEPLGGYTEQSRRRTQLFEIDGYFRMRTDYMHNFNLSEGYTSKTWKDSTNTDRAGLPPFPTSLDCPSPTPGATPPYPGCGHHDLAGANIRFRLEPTLNVTDQVRIHSQFDVLDNTILGSTPDSLAGLNRQFGNYVPQAPIPFLYTSQDPPEVGQNGYTSSIRAKRAWAEIDTEFGSLRFGRMPWHFGRGISYNDGSCLDCDGGTTVDRIALLTEMYGHQFTLALDYGSQGLTSNQLAIGRYASNGYPIDLAQDDDVFEYMLAITKIDNPVHLREKIDRGDLVLNYGVQLVYRTQQSSFAEDKCAMSANGTPVDPTVCPTIMGSNDMPVSSKEQLMALTPLSAYFVQPSLWLKLYYRALTVEFEGTGVFGRMSRGGVLLDPADAASNDPAYFRQFGGVIASELHLFRDSFFVGFETGGASGDQAENPSQYLNYRWRFAQQPQGDHTITDFKFSPEYHIDSILFRQILGTVTNAIYFKPAVSYWFDLAQSRQLGIAGSFIYSLAQVPVSTPGNALGYGVEMNVSANYRNTAEGFYAGMTWGVLWPLGALNRPAGVWGPLDSADAKAAQVLRGFLGVKF